jgi:hypothetical protein
LAASEAGGETYEVSAENALALVLESVMIIHNNKNQKETWEAQVTKGGDDDEEEECFRDVIGNNQICCCVSDVGQRA